MAEAIYTERRLSYAYGVNSGRVEGTGSFKDLQERIERQTMGPVDVTKREERVVIKHEWKEV